MEKINYSVLVHKELTGEISTQESILLGDWLAADTAHPVLAENIRKVWVWSHTKMSGWEPDVDQGLSKLKRRIEAEEQIEVDQQPRIFSILKYAAAAIFLFSLGYFVSGVGNRPDLEWQVAETDASEVKAISLADGSQVTLNGATFFTFPENFGDQDRVVKLDGEGFFKITRDETRPFYIEMDHGTVRVLGTRFNITNDTDANSTTISVASGKVAFIPKGSTQEFILTTNDKLIYNANTKQYRQVKDFSPNDWSWKTNKLVFKDTKLEEVIPAIEKHFDIRLSLANEKIANCRSITATFAEATRADVLSALTLTIGLELKKAKAADTFVLFGGSCE